MIDRIKPIDQFSMDAAELFAAAPPVIDNRNKAVVFDIACPQGCTHGGRVEYSRWPTMEVPSGFPPFHPETYSETRPGFYDYKRLLPHSAEWHVNFADPRLFFGYGGPLLAQDEIMAAEHPVLGAIVEYLHRVRMEARTVVNGGNPTPVLVVGAERRCHLETTPNEDEGRPEGLYGNLFAQAPAEVVTRATKALDPPTKTNIIAIAAPMGGFGPYTHDQVERIVRTAYSGFHAAVLETRHLWGEGVPVVIHTGFWGCGAFGGNRELMAILQVFAAHLASVDHVVFHGGGDAGVEVFRRAMGKLRDLFPQPPSDGMTPVFLENVTRHGFRWGISEGT